MNFTDDGEGYEISPHVAKLLQGDDDRATVEAFIADIFAQRIKTHHQGAMESDRFEEALPNFIERAPKIIGIIVMQDDGKDFSIGKVQKITDDMVRLDGDVFCKRYGIYELFQILTEEDCEETKSRPDRYDMLARHLSPDDPAEGMAQIDLEILRYERARARPRNLTAAYYWATRLVMAVGTMGLGAHLIMWLLARSPAGSDPLAPYLGSAAGILSLPLAIGLTLIGFLPVVFYDPFEKMPFSAPRLPSPMASWLGARGYKNGLSYWYETSWDWQKIRANRREILGFTFWRKTPCPVEDYPTIEVRASRPDPHWEYLDSPEGRAAREAYFPCFEGRMHAWRSVCLKAILGTAALLLAASFAPFFITTSFDAGWRALGLLAFILCALPIGFGWIPPMRRMPRVVQQYWFRDLPVGAQDYRDHMIALSA